MYLNNLKNIKYNIEPVVMLNNMCTNIDSSRNYLSCKTDNLENYLQQNNKSKNNKNVDVDKIDNLQKYLQQNNNIKNNKNVDGNKMDNLQKYLHNNKINYNEVNTNKLRHDIPNYKPIHESLNTYINNKVHDHINYNNINKSMNNQNITNISNNKFSIPKSGSSLSNNIKKMS
jgi:hypothetical protein